MILINLLPHREAARKRRKEAFQATMFASFLIGLAIAGAVYWWFQMMITAQQERNAFLQSEIKVLEEQIKEIARQILPASPTLAVVGPFRSTSKFERLIK